MRLRELSTEKNNKKHIKKINEASNKPVKLYYFNVDSANKDIAKELGLKQDRNGLWYLPKFSTSGTPFNIKYSSVVRIFGNHFKTVNI